MMVRHQFSYHDGALGLIIHVLCLVYAITTTVQAVEVETVPASESSHAIFRLVDWLNGQQSQHESQGNEVESSIRINSSLDIHNMAPPGLPSIWSFIANEDIQEGEILTQIPWSYIIGGSLQRENEHKEIDDDENDTEPNTASNTMMPSHCRTVQKLVHAVTTDDQTTNMITDPYLDYLWSSVPRLPSSWSNFGQSVLMEILGGTEIQLSPPGNIISLLEDEMFACQALLGEDFGSISPHDENSDGSLGGTWKWAAAIVQEKSHYDMMVPLWDLYTHRNGQYHNVRTEVQRGVAHTVRARRLITAGETLHASFDFCDDTILDGTSQNYDYTEKDEITEQNPCAHMRTLVDDGYGTPEIFRDYGLIEDFPQRWSYYPGAVEVEDYEDKWTYRPEQITFTLELTDKEVGDEENQSNIQNGSTIQVVWSDHLLFDNRGRNYIRRIFRRELRRLYRFQNVRFDLDRTDSPMDEIPLVEWSSIRKYYSSIVRALKSAIHSLVNDDNEAVQVYGPSLDGGVCGNKTSSNEGYCPADDIDSNTVHYDDLKDEEDYTNYIFPDCPTTQLVEFYDYEDLEVFQTNYQKLTFLSRGRDRDVCMNIESTLQICSNYRPHYHEFFVHFPARYLKKIERVIFIGGGDSMLLHEVLKYPDIENIVGLELDQQVTRKSFKYFQSQPHFDNDRVEWWYGDATKSLPLLPKEYWGSFDLILVDLSETVMSTTVTGKLDIFSALSLLLKPEGIMVKNEPYIDQFSDFFDYSIQLFYGSPKVCTQVLVMGSNKVDFLHSPVQNHDRVQTLLFEPMKDPSDRYRLLHDYRKNNATEQGKCSNEQSTHGEGEEEVMYGRKAGLLEVVDIDAVPVSQFDVAKLESNLYTALKEEELIPISTMKGNNSDEKWSDILVVLKEGFVVVRPWPEYNYFAVDIQLWGAFSKLPTLRSKLVEVIAGNDGSKDSSLTVSSYRIVTGGMFGTHTWEADKETIGIQMRQTRDCENPHPAIERAGSVGDDNDILTKLALEATVTSAANLLSGNDLVAVVACGLADDKGSCLSIETLSKHPKVGKVIPMWACPDVVRATTTTADDTSSDDDIDVHSKMYKCEKSIVSKLDEIFSNVQAHDESPPLDLDMFVLDPSAPYSMAQIYNSVLGFVHNRDDWMAPEHVLLAPNPLFDVTNAGTDDGTKVTDDFKAIKEPNNESNWRRNFLERYRKEYHSVPLFRAELMVRRHRMGDLSSSVPSSIPWMDVGVLSSNDRHFFHNLTIMESSFQRELDRSASETDGPSVLTVTVQLVTGGLRYYDAEDVTYDNRMYYPESYNKTSAIEQYQTQRPLARHSIFQYELVVSPSTGDQNETAIISMPTWKQLEEILILSLDAARYKPFAIERYDDEGLIGDGALLAVPFTSSSPSSSTTTTSNSRDASYYHHQYPNHNMAIMIWDGQIQVDVHLFSSSNMEVAVADTFADTFGRLSQVLSVRLRDDQPRGYGRVVNFETDIVSVVVDDDNYRTPG